VVRRLRVHKSRAIDHPTTPPSRSDGTGVPIANLPNRVFVKRKKDFPGRSSALGLI
jgi:hypothetical protein